MTTVAGDLARRRCPTRLAGQTKAGFFPAEPEAVAAILRHLRLPPDPPPDGQAIHILDPCAGEGKALGIILEGLSHPGVPVRGHAVELNASRSARIREAYPEVNLLGPCSFHATRITSRSISMLYLNPPFDHEFGGGRREEESFLSTATYLLPPGGVLAFVLPYNQVLGNASMLTSLDIQYEDIEVYLFPDGHRPYRECCVLARRRKGWLSAKDIESRGELHRRGLHHRYERHTDGDVEDIARLGGTQYDHWRDGHPVELSRRAEVDTWTIPYTAGPKQFAKTDLTDEEIEVELARSPLHRKLRTRIYSPMQRPPLPLNRGHTSLLLLTGLLDGYVPSEPPHVVRGFCGKEEKLVKTESYTTEKGVHVEKRTSAEQPRPVVRAVWADGTIRTFAEGKPADQPVTEDFTVEDTGEFSEEDE